jgi:hypothetical protein
MVVLGGKVGGWLRVINKVAGILERERDLKKQREFLSACRRLENLYRGT